MKIKVTEKGTFSAEEGAPFSILLENLGLRFRDIRLTATDKKDTPLLTGYCSCNSLHIDHDRG